MTSALVETWTSIVGGGLVFAGADERNSGDTRRSAPYRQDTSEPAADTHDAAPNRPLLVCGIPADELLERLRQGDRTALETWYRALHDPLWRMAIVLTGSREHAEEIVQDVFLALWAQRERVSSDVRAYLYASVRNAAKLRYRHTHVIDRLQTRVARGYTEPPAVAHSDTNPATHVETADFYDAFRRALTALSDRERIALRLRLEDELTFDQIGTSLGISKVGARKLVLRAEAKIRELLADFRDFHR